MLGAEFLNGYTICVNLVNTATARQDTCMIIITQSINLYVKAGASRKKKNKIFDFSGYSDSINGKIPLFASPPIHFQYDPFIEHM